MDSPKRIVVLDDDSRVREVVRRALKPPEFEVHEFGDGRDALMKLHEIRPDLILSDVWMPDMDGRLFLQVVKRSPEMKDVPFIFLSAVRSDSAIQAGLEAGANSFLMKPFPLALLNDKVRALLNMSPVTPAPRPLEAPPPDDSGPGPVRALPEKASATEPSAPPRAGPPPVAQEEERGTATAAVSPVQTGRYRPVDLEGEFTLAWVGGERIPVLTEAENRPNFTVTTCMTSKGHAIRKIETSWQHPLERREDLVLAQRQIKLQHHQTLAALEQIGLGHTSRRIVWDTRSRLVNGSVLCWALCALLEEARGRVESAPAAFRATLDGLKNSVNGVRVFRVTENDRVLLTCHSAPLAPQAAVAAAAEWAAGFVAGAMGLKGELAVARIRQVTATRQAQLERMGFYSVVAVVAGRETRSPSVA